VKISWNNIRFYLGTILYIIGFAQIVPVITSIVLGESLIFILLLVSTMLTTIFIAYIIKRNSRYSEVNILEAFTIMVLAFLIPGFTCAIPILAYNVNFIDALFEGVSAITTTGLSALPPHALTPGVHFLRAYYQWLGGFSIAMLVLLFLATPGSAAYSIYMAHLGRFKVTPLSVSTVKAFLKIYVILTLIFAFIYLASGLSFFDSIINALTTISTGGFSTISTFKQNAMYAGLILMFISAQPLAIYYFLYKGEFKRIVRDPQLLLFTTVLLTTFLISLPTLHTGLIEYLFQLTSALSTTGYSALNNSTLPDSNKYILSILMIIGAGFGSTGGGLKQLRLYIILKSIIHSIQRTTIPSKAVSYIRVGDKTLSESDILWAYTLFSLYIIVLSISVFIFLLHGYSFPDSLFETSSALATTGLSVGLSSHTLQFIPKVVLIIDMFLGRIEIIPLLIVSSHIIKKLFKL